MEVKTREFHQAAGQRAAQRPIVSTTHLSTKAIVLGADAPHWYQIPPPSLSFTIACRASRWVWMK